jgi:hypothetical protein
MRMPFGRHRGKTLEEIPPAYLQWVLEVPDISDMLREAIERVFQPKQDHDAETKRLREKIADLTAEIDFLEFQLEEKEERIEALKKSPSLGWWKDWWNRAVKASHPDRGGSQAVMALLNEANEKIKS